jgi:trehalose 6-phosphate phosphatase
MGSLQNLPPPLSLPEMLGRGRVAVFCDFDGTLVELAETPDAIEPTEHMAQALEKLSDRLGGRMAVVSGRSIADIAAHIGRPAISMAGSHGADCQRADGSGLGAGALTVPDTASAQLKAFAEENALGYEAKSHGAALHYRNAPQHEECARAFAATIASEFGLAIKHGKCVVELVQEGASKNKAVRAFMAQAPFAGATPVFIGDDMTDEDGFAAASALGGLGILVGEREATKAQCSLPDVAAVHKWLELF